MTKSEMMATIESSVDRSVKKAVEKAIAKGLAALKSEITDMFDKMESKIFDLEERCDEHQVQMVKKDSIISKLQDNLEKALISTNKNDQYNRRNMFNIHGVSEEVGKTGDHKAAVAQLLTQKLQTPVARDDIDATHPIGKTHNGRSTFIVKLHQRELRDKLMSRRRLLKQTGTKNIVLQDNLTPQNLDLLKKVKEHDNVTAAWSWQGVIWAVNKHERKVRVDHPYVNLDGLLN